MAKKAKKAASKAAKKATKPAKKPAGKKAPKPSAAKPAKAAASSAATPAAPAKVLKPLTMKQRLALIRVDPATGRCPHGLAPETCSFCMSI